MKRNFSPLLIILSILLSACGTTNAQTPAVSGITQSTTSAYPSASTTAHPGINPAYLAPGQDTEELNATPGPIPTPDIDTGVVIGRFLNNGKPIPNAILYLAEVKKADNGKEMFAAISLIYSPRAFTDRDGNFVFANVKPAKYGFVLDTVVTEFLLRDPKNKEADLLFIVEAGKQLDLGNLDFLELPPLSQ
jgi:hypothetical protein